MSVRKAVISRIGLSLLAGVAIAALINEISFLFLKETQRAPQRIELIIPQGTAERVERGEAAPSIPKDLNLVVGDTLVIVNNDNINHQLGPLWIPAGSSASFSLDISEKYVAACSFRPDKFIGLDVREALTLRTRVEGILVAGIPLGALLSVYSLVAWPLKKES